MRFAGQPWLKEPIRQRLWLHQRLTERRGRRSLRLLIRCLLFRQRLWFHQRLTGRCGHLPLQIHQCQLMYLQFHRYLTERRGRRSLRLYQCQRNPRYFAGGHGDLPYGISVLVTFCYITICV